MIRNSLIALFVLVLLCIGIFAFWAAKVSRQRSNDILAEFNRTDSSLQRTNERIQRTAGQLPEVELAAKVSAIGECIDSMKHELVILSRQKTGDPVPFSYPDKTRLLALKQKLAELNGFISTQYTGKRNIEAKDMVNIDDIPNGKATTPWEVYYFENTSIFGIITELSFIRSQTLKLQYKTTH